MNTKLIGINPMKIQSLTIDSTDPEVSRANDALDKMIKMIGEQTPGPNNIFNRLEAIKILDNVRKDKERDWVLRKAASDLSIILQLMNDEFIVAFNQ